MVIIRNIVIGKDLDNDVSREGDIEASMFTLLYEAARRGIKGGFTFRVKDKHWHKVFSKGRWIMWLTCKMSLTSRNGDLLESSDAVLYRQEYCSRCHKLLKRNDYQRGAYGGIHYFYNNQERAYFCAKCDRIRFLEKFHPEELENDC